MATNRKRPSAEEWTADKWYREFFNRCLLPEEEAESYAVIFAQHELRLDMLPVLNKDWLKEMKIVKVGHIIEILKAAQQVSAQEQRSEISHIKPPTPSTTNKVSLKSVVKTKPRKDSEAGKVVKRPVPDEGPTLSIKLPARTRPLPHSNQEDEASTVPRPAPSSAQSVEVSSSTEKKQKRSVFDRLGMPASRPSNTAQSSPAAGILKKAASCGDVPHPPDAMKYGPVERPASAELPRRCVSPTRLVLTPSELGRARPPARPSPADAGDEDSCRSPGPGRPGAAAPRPSVEPSFRVTMSMKLSNPLVTKVPNGPLNRKQQERRSLTANCSSDIRASSIRASSTHPAEKQYYGSMAADHVQMFKDLGAEKALKQRLGSKQDQWSKLSVEKKRVSFGNVRTKEIPAVPGTQSVSSSPSTICKQMYTGSVALRTAKKL